MKTSLIAIIIGSLLFFSFKEYSKSVKDLDCLATKISSKFWDFNSFEVKVSQELESGDFKIINQNSGKEIYKNGHSFKGIKNEYGHCSFNLYYKEERIFEMGHFKTNTWHTNDYFLKIELEGGKIKPSLEITGKNASYNDFYINEI